MSYRIIEWQRTETQFVAILQAASVFRPGTIRVAGQQGSQTVLAGEVALTGREEPYALGFSRRDLTFDEAKTMAMRWLESYSEQQRAGRVP